jgi:N-acetylglucosaminyldiphosphoundecaprenol N-acetyl-beta-D-mannosaminyltransferase
MFIAAAEQRRCLPVAFLGLVFDPLSLDEAVDLVRRAVRENHRLMFATPNVNFAASAASNPDFRKAVLACDLQLIDGMPLVWAGRLLGLPIPERVAGSSLFEALQASKERPPLRVFFFGGDAGVAQAASGALDRTPSGLCSAGYLDPGRGSIEEMSSDALIDAINAAKADFLCVALGAVKGHMWIARNAGRLNVPVISHLGAVVNFVAGRLSRAPRWMQRTGLEWVWRILREPQLARRYRQDGVWLLRASFGQLLPAWLDLVRARPEISGCSWEIHSIDKGSQTLRIAGHLNRSALLHNDELRQLKPDRGLPLHIDLKDLDRIDSAGVAWLLRCCYCVREGSSLRISGLNAEVSRSLRRFGAGFITTEYA